jgi:hypothetical protein
MADTSMSKNVKDQPGSPNSEQAPRPIEKSQASSSEPLAQQAQAISSDQRAAAGRMPLFRR